MPFERPHIAQIKARIEADVDGRLVAGDPRLRRDLIRVLSQMEAGVAHGLYGDLQWLAENLLPNTRDPNILQAWAEIYGVPRLGATRAEGPIAILGNPGFTLAAGDVVFQYSDGRRYELLDDVSAAGPYAEGRVRAVDGGAAGNLSDGETITLLDPLPGIQSEVFVIAPGISGGADIESTTAWSARLLQRIQQPPQGGSLSDYERWAREAHPAITNVWPKGATPIAGFVTVYCMAYGSTPTGEPEPTVIDAVKANIEAKRPVQGRYYVLAPSLKEVDPIISLNPNTPAVQAAVEASLRDLFEREAAPGTAIPLSHVGEAISLAPGEQDHMTNLTPVDLQPGAGQLLVLGDITWVPL